MKRSAPVDVPNNEVEEKKRRESDGSEGLGVIEEGVKLESFVEYLKEKGIKRITEFWEQLDPEGRRRLKSLAYGDEKLTATFDQEFGKFSEATNNSWTTDSDLNEKIALFWHRYPNKQYLKVLRCQLSGLCFFHACVVLQHYLVSINESNDSTNVGMLDIGKYEGSILKGKALENYLTIPHGGETISHLKKLCDLTAADLNRVDLPTINEKSTSIEISARNIICDRIMDLLEEQPALVSSFVVMDDFYDSKDVRFTIPDLECWPDEERTHAMVLVGMRKSTSGEYYFLLQNWWRGRYFIEVSYDYLTFCQPRITFVKKKLTQISSNVEFISLETSLETMADKCECLIDSV